MHVNVKMIPVKTIAGMGGWRGIKNGGEGEFKYDVFNTLQELL
jgi:hypothetical protein